MKTIIVTLLLATSAFAQSIQERITKLENPKDVMMVYDKFKDLTTVKSKQFVSKALKTSHTKSSSIGVIGAFQFPGEAMTGEADYIWLYFDTSNYDWTYLDNHNLIVIADNIRVDVGDGIREAPVGSAGIGLVSEKLSYKLTRSDYAKIVNARTVEIQLGPFEGTIEKSGIAKLRNILFLSAR